MGGVGFVKIIYLGNLGYEKVISFFFVIKLFLRVFLVLFRGISSK